MGGRGSMGGGISASAVDTDKLWRDRIRTELLFQRQWKDEYGFMVGGGGGGNGGGASAPDAAAAAATTGNAASAAPRSLTGAVATTTTAAASGAVNAGAFSAAELEGLQKELQRAQYTSTCQASYKFDRARLLELGAGSHRKQKFRV